MWKPAAASVRPSGEKTTDAIARLADRPQHRSGPRVVQANAALAGAVATSDPSGETATEFTATAGGV